MPKRFTLEVVVLLLGLTGQITAVLLVGQPVDRLVVSLACLVMIVWSSVRLGPIISAVKSPEEFVHDRRFFRLRSNVVQLLAEIRRLNWLVVDERRGVRRGEQTEAEIRQVENRLNDLLERIRATAGVESDGDYIDEEKGGDPAT